MSRLYAYQAAAKFISKELSERGYSVSVDDLLAVSMDGTVQQGGGTPANLGEVVQNQFRTLRCADRCDMNLLCIDAVPPAKDTLEGIK